jgi:hypothetical protein
MFKDKNGETWASEELYKEHLIIVSKSKDKAIEGFKKYRLKLSK